MISDSERRDRFEAIADEVYEPIQRYLRRRAAPSDAEDALSEVMLTMWRRLDDAPAGHVLPWGYGIARRILANQRRGQARHLRLVRRLGSEPKPIPVPDHADGGPDAELAAALDAQSREDREILRLWAWEQLEPREIASVLDVSVNAATLRLSRARKRLAVTLARQNPTAAGHNQVEGAQGDTR